MKVIVVENDDYWLRRCVKIAKNLSIVTNLNIEIIPFKNFNDELENLIFDGDKKVYALDINLDHIHGNEIAHIIRDEAKDWDSKIIMFSEHDRQKDIIADLLNVLVYVSKRTRFEETFSKSVETAIKALVGSKSIIVREHGQDYPLIIDDITEIEKEKESKYCIVKTRYGKKYRHRESLLKINKKLNFIRTNNHTLVNPIQIRKSKISIKK